MKERRVIASDYFVGLDLGKKRDFSAIAVVERAGLLGDWDAVAWAHRKEFELRLRRLERLPLGTRYPEVERRVTAVLEGLEGHGECSLLVDATGVGPPVMDHLLETGLGKRMRGVMVTAGEVERHEDGMDHVPKKNLISRLQVLLEYGELKIASNLKHAADLMKEMEDMEVRMTASGHEQFAAWRVGEHDDLVFAVALACWGVGKRYPRRPTGADAYWIGVRE